MHVCDRRGGHADRTNAKCRSADAPNPIGNQGAAERFATQRIRRLPAREAKLQEPCAAHALEDV